MRIAIVNDMTTAVEAMRHVLLQTPEHELAWVARDGNEAVERCAQDTPDLVLMDLIMPKMDGVEATRRIMAQSPCAIVVVTASVNENTARVFEAMGAGALDAVNTPTLEQPGTESGASPLLGKIKTIHRLIGNGLQKTSSPPALRAAGKSFGTPQLVALGASAGGPAALATVLSQLPEDFSAAIVVVQHLDVQFTKTFASWLAQQTKLSVRIAGENDHPTDGTVLLAGSGDHLVFTGPTTLGYTPTPVDCAYRPSIDILFRSIQKFWRGEITAVLLTGMGSDGAEGLRALHAAGHHTIVQDRATSAVFGMPKAAIELKAASEILPLNKIGLRLNTRLNRNHK